MNNNKNAGHVFSIINNLNSSRTQTFTYDQVTRITSAGTTAASGTYCWGYQYNYDAWANLLSQAGWSPNYNGCSEMTMGSVNANGNNQISGFSYDASGNTQNDGTIAYTYNGESQMATANGVTYAYDGDGRRVYKSNGKLYWYGAGGDILAETDLSGNTPNEYIFFGGKRIAMLPAGGNPIYYVEDMLGSSRVITTNTGAVCYDADFDPYGGEHAYTNTCSQNYKFEGKERDTETGNDDFGARSYSSRFGRWLSADWSNVPVPVPYANLTNPQTLNLYSMVADDPESFADLDGHTSTQIYQLANPAASSAWDPMGAVSMSDMSGLTLEEYTALAAEAAAEAAQRQVQQQLSYGTLAANYPGHGTYPTDPNSPNSIWSLIGGHVEMNARDVHGNANNSCAVRMSYALNKSGLSIPKGRGAVSGADGKQYFLRVADLQKFLTRALGQPQRLAGGSFRGPSGSSGILSFNIPFKDATGHFTLWNGRSVIDAKEPYQSWPAPTSALFWRVP